MIKSFSLLKLDGIFFDLQLFVLFFDKFFNYLNFLQLF